MARIRVTGWIDTDELPFDDVDLSSEMGLSEMGYVKYATGYNLPGLEDIDFKLESEDEGDDAV